MIDFPILSLLIWLPIIIGLILVISNDISKSLSSTITIITTLIVFLISLKLFHAYNYTFGVAETEQEKENLIRKFLQQLFRMSV